MYDDTLITVSEAARILGLSASRVRQLDHFLLPLKTSRGIRLYKRGDIQVHADEIRGGVKPAKWLRRLVVK